MQAICTTSDMFISEKNYLVLESEVLSTIDELNQYLLGHVSTISLVKSLTELQSLLCEVETRFHEK